MDIENNLNRTLPKEKRWQPALPTDSWFRWSRQTRCPSAKVKNITSRVAAVIQYGAKAKGEAKRTVFAEKIAGEDVVDDTGPSTDGDVHVVGLLPQPVQVVPALRVLGLPRRLLREPLGVQLVGLAAVADAPRLRRRRLGTSEGGWRGGGGWRRRRSFDRRQGRGIEIEEGWLADGDVAERHCGGDWAELSWAEKRERGRWIDRRRRLFYR